MIFRMRVYTHGGWAHRRWVSTTFLTRKNSKFSCAPDGIRTFGSPVQRFNHWANPSPPLVSNCMQLKHWHSTVMRSMTTTTKKMCLRTWRYQKCNICSCRNTIRLTGSEIAFGPIAMFMLLPLETALIINSCLDRFDRLFEGTPTLYSIGDCRSICNERKHP